MAITENIHRIGNFTSSEIHNLIKEGKVKGTFGAPALTYIEEKNFERELLRSIGSEASARPLLWGRLLEKRAFDLLDTSYTLNSDETIMHPEFDFWSGSPDGFKLGEKKAVFDIKCPYTLKSFCQLVRPIFDSIEMEIDESGIWLMKSLINGYKNKKGIDVPPHKDAEKYYWQLVSNAIITNCTAAELIIYMPYKSELLAIDEMIDGLDLDAAKQYNFIKYANENELPYLMTNGKYKNIHKISFDIPQSDIDFLTSKVIAASKMLEPRYVIAHYDNDVNATIIQNG